MFPLSFVAMRVGHRSLALFLSSAAATSTAPCFAFSSTKPLLFGLRRQTRTVGSFLRSRSIMFMSTKATADDKPSRVALLQFPVTEDKERNQKTASEYIGRASKEGAKLVVLPEIWNSPYATAAFPEYAEDLSTISSSPSAHLLQQHALKHEMWIVGGSIPEREGDKIYNTCLVYNPKGELVAKHRKVHLFDIDVPGGITFRESDTLSAGKTMTAFDAGKPFGMIGIGIWYGTGESGLSLGCALLLLLLYSLDCSHAFVLLPVNLVMIFDFQNMLCY
mmetsp:Transcript_4696/g.10556  ORF Transcript_4696/g.10556 Transcript_4696/m.10556 type:complete len:277 (+) Transcript_4696:108-938(+)